MTQVLLPPSSPTLRDDGTAQTAPNSSQWAAAPASLPPVLPFLLPMGNSIHKSGLEVSGRRTGARALDRGCAPVVIRPPGKARFLPLAAQLPNDPGGLLSCGRVRSPPRLSSVSYPALDHPSAPRTASPGRSQAESSLGILETRTPGSPALLGSDLCGPTTMLDLDPLEPQ